MHHFVRRMKRYILHFQLWISEQKGIGNFGEIFFNWEHVPPKLLLQWLYVPAERSFLVVADAAKVRFWFGSFMLSNNYRSMSLFFHETPLDGTDHRLALSAALLFSLHLLFLVRFANSANYGELSLLHSVSNISIENEKHGRSRRAPEKLPFELPRKEHAGLPLYCNFEQSIKTVLDRFLLIVSTVFCSLRLWWPHNNRKKSAQQSFDG